MIMGSPTTLELRLRVYGSGFRDALGCGFSYHFNELRPISWWVAATKLILSYYNRDALTYYLQYTHLMGEHPNNQSTE